jgi:nucleotide-binding universal stress UspA family protein
MINTSQPAAVNIDYTVQRVLVPISNIETASSLLELAWSFTRMPEASEDRKVSVIIPLVVLAGNLDEEADLFDDLTPILEAFELRGCPLVLRTRRASNVARGILDVANEENADLIVLGVHRRQRGEVELGVVVENVMATAPCDVAIFRSWDKRYDVKRVLIPNDGSPHARRAARLGVKIAQHYDVPAETIYIQDNYRDRTEGEKLLADSLEDIHPAIEIKRTVVQAQNPVKGLLTRVQPDDLLLLGYSQRSNIEKWLFGNFAGKIINEAETDVVLVGTPKEHPVFLSGIPAAFRRFFLMLTPAEQTDIVRNSYDQASPNLDYLLLIAISAALASLGLLVNSTAVVIGAMLVAPFMQPCIAFAVALTNGQYGCTVWFAGAESATN